MNKIIVFLKGMLMGICDAIPGISGGTIAFITGIYEKLINTVKDISWDLVKNVKDKKMFLKSIKEIDLPFLFTLFSGILLAIFLFSGVIKYLLDNYYVLTISFFIGLILASSKIIYEKIHNHTKNAILGIIGLITGVALAFIIPINTQPNALYLFFGGFIAISAMFLPGISGAFILLIIGLYNHIINAISDLKNNFLILLPFVMGAAIGAVTISKFISFLLKKHHDNTLYLLLGLMIGSVSVPVRNIIEKNPTNTQIFLSLTLVIIGIAVVLFIDNYAKKTR